MRVEGRGGCAVGWASRFAVWGMGHEAWVSRLTSAFRRSSHAMPTHAPYLMPHAAKQAGNPQHAELGPHPSALGTRSVYAPPVTPPPVHRYAALALAAFSGLILSASVACSWLIAHGWAMQWRLLFRLICHGMPSRCLLLFGVPMPICARCTAIYGGLIAGTLLFALLPAMRELPVRIAAVTACLPMALDGGTQLIRLRESTNILRVETGLVAGIAIAMWCLTAARSASRLALTAGRGGEATLVHSSFESS